LNVLSPLPNLWFGGGNDVPAGNVIYFDVKSKYKDYPIKYTK